MFIHKILVTLSNIISIVNIQNVKGNIYNTIIISYLIDLFWNYIFNHYLKLVLQ